MSETICSSASEQARSAPQRPPVRPPCDSQDSSSSPPRRLLGEAEGRPRGQVRAYNPDRGFVASMRSPPSSVAAECTQQARQRGRRRGDGVATKRCRCCPLVFDWQRTSPSASRISEALSRPARGARSSARNIRMKPTGATARCAARPGPGRRVDEQRDRGDATPGRPSWAPGRPTRHAHLYADGPALADAAPAELGRTWLRAAPSRRRPTARCRDLSASRARSCASRLFSSSGPAAARALSRSAQADSSSTARAPCGGVGVALLFLWPISRPAMGARAAPAHLRARSSSPGHISRCIETTQTLARGASEGFTHLVVAGAVVSAGSFSA